MIKGKRYISFSRRLSAAYLCMLLIPLLIITAINYKNFKETTTEQTLEMNERSLKQTTAFLNYTLSSLNDIIDTISFDEIIQTLLKTGSTYDRTMEGNWFLQRTDILNIIYNPYTTSELQSVQVYPIEGPSRFEESSLYKQLDQERKNQWDSRIESLALFKTVLVPSSLFTGDYPKTIYLVKRIPDFNSINKYIGMIKGDIPQEVFQSIISDAAASKGTTTLLYNSQGEIIAHNGSPDLCDVSFINTLVDENAIPTTGRLSEVDINNNSYFIGRTKIDLTDWSLVYLINSDEVLSASDAYQKQMFWMVLALFLASIPLSLYTTKTVTNRIRKLQDHIEASREKGFDIEALENGTDEIGQLTVCYDDMASNLHILLEEQFQLGYQIKNLEFKVLQATIDPHFLYNSLDLMSWKALQNQDKDSANLAKALSRFYKLSLGHGQTMVLLSQELEHVRTYVEIQNMRFDGKINLQIEVPEQLQRLAVFKIMLQPIVENAIIHGIRERSDEKGTIRIKARTKIDMLIISISDNGVGMTSETIESILLSSSDEHSGYGVWNINERIRLAHGDDYGLRFYSKLGVGTVVFVKLPIFPTQSPLC